MFINNYQPTLALNRSKPCHTWYRNVSEGEALTPDSIFPCSSELREDDGEVNQWDRILTMLFKLCN
jgi:hypothetical protein